MPRLTSIICLIVAVIGLAGCANYRLGTGSTPQFSRLYIAPISSDTLIPQAQALITTQLREAFLKDGRIALVESPSAADAVLRVTLTGYQREIAVSRPDDTKLARRFDVSLRARATLTTGADAKNAFTDRPLVVSLGVFNDSGQQQSEYQALPLLAEKLAQEALHAALDTW
jgi:hypothetical protein